MRLTFKELKDQIAKVVPRDVPYTVELEAGNIAIVTPCPCQVWRRRRLDWKDREAGQAEDCPSPGRIDHEE